MGAIFESGCYQVWGIVSQMFGEFSQGIHLYSQSRVKQSVCLLLFFVCIKIELCLFAKKKFSSMIKRFRH